MTVFVRKFFAPHIKKLRDWRCSECDRGVEPGQSFIEGKRVGLCTDCAREVRETLRP